MMWHQPSLVVREPVCMLEPVAMVALRSDNGIRHKVAVY